MEASIPFQQVLEIAGAASGDAAEVDPTRPVCVLPLLFERMVCSSVPGEVGRAAEISASLMGKAVKHYFQAALNCLNLCSIPCRALWMACKKLLIVVVKA